MAKTMGPTLPCIVSLQHEPKQTSVLLSFTRSLSWFCYQKLTNIIATRYSTDIAKCDENGQITGKTEPHRYCIQIQDRFFTLTSVNRIFNMATTLYLSASLACTAWLRVTKNLNSDLNYSAFKSTVTNSCIVSLS